MTDSKRITVAVIGLGALGLVALKNLVEEGFDVTGFERNGYVGGLWQYRDDDQTSVMQSTIVNISKERGCFTDFPFPEDAATHPTAAEIHKYLVEYADYFNLPPHFRLNTHIRQVTFDEERQKWTIHIDGTNAQYFDKIVFATGTNSLPNIPQIEGIDKFEGQCLHSRAFKRPSDFEAKKVLVVGFGNTAADTATQLVGHASKIYIAHRHGSYIIPRIVKGRSVDHSVTFRISLIQENMMYYFPNLGERMFNAFVKKLQDSCFQIRPEWRFEPAPSLKQSVPIVSDNLIGFLEDGSIESVAGLKRTLGGKEVELDDGAKFEVDAIIWCTGYKSTYSLLDKEYDPTTHTTAVWSSSVGSNGKPLPRLYQNVFSLVKPDSLAFMGSVAFATGAFQLYDIASMAVAQVWKGISCLPPREEMEKAVDEHHEWVCGLAQRGTVFPGIVQPGPWMRWMNDAAGTGVNEYLGYGSQGWAFWLRDRKLCNLLMGGMYSPHIFRLFEGKRKSWEGAREAIEKVNAASGKDKAI